MTNEQKKLFNTIFKNEDLPANYDGSAYDYRDDLSFLKEVPLSQCDVSLWLESFPEYDPNHYILLHHACNEETPIQEVMETWARLVMTNMHGRRPAELEVSSRDQMLHYAKLYAYMLVYMSESRRSDSYAFMSGFLSANIQKRDAFLSGLYPLFVANPTCYVPLLKPLVTTVKGAFNVQLYYPEHVNSLEWDILMDICSLNALDNAWKYLSKQNILNEEQEWKMVCMLISFLTLKEGQSVIDESPRFSVMLNMYMNVIKEICECGVQEVIYDNLLGLYETITKPEVHEEIGLIM